VGEVRGRGILRVGHDDVERRRPSVLELEVDLA
jgi:hypothetical protein